MNPQQRKRALKSALRRAIRRGDQLDVAYITARLTIEFGKA